MRLNDDQVVALVNALVTYECRRDPSDVDLLQDGATSLPALRPILTQYIRIKADRELAAERAAAVSGSDLVTVRAAGPVEAGEPIPPPDGAL